MLILLLVVTCVIRKILLGKFHLKMALITHNQWLFGTISACRREVRIFYPKFHHFRKYFLGISVGHTVCKFISITNITVAWRFFCTMLFYEHQTTAELSKSLRKILLSSCVLIPNSSFHRLKCSLKSHLLPLTVLEKPFHAKNWQMALCLFRDLLNTIDNLVAKLQTNCLSRGVRGTRFDSSRSQIWSMFNLWFSSGGMDTY